MQIFKKVVSLLLLVGSLFCVGLLWSMLGEAILNNSARDVMRLFLLLVTFCVLFILHELIQYDDDGDDGF